jgi:hypothetical protein
LRDDLGLELLSDIIQSPLDSSLGETADSIVLIARLESVEYNWLARKPRYGALELLSEPSKLSSGAGAVTGLSKE